MKLSGSGEASAGFDGLFPFFDFFQEPVIYLLQRLFAQQQYCQVVFDQPQGHGPVDFVAVLVMFLGLLRVHFLLGICHEQRAQVYTQHVGLEILPDPQCRLSGKVLQLQRILLKAGPRLHSPALVVEGP